MKEYTSHETFTNNEEEKIVEVRYEEESFGEEPNEKKEIIKYTDVEAEIEKLTIGIAALTEKKAYYELIKSNVDKER